MEELWYKQMGFEKNPFSIKPIQFNENLVNATNKINEILQKIELNKILLIDGEYGTGKTSILKAIIKKFGGKKQVVYYNCNKTEDAIDLKRILKQRYNWFLRILGFKGKKMILLLDEVQDISEEDQKRIVEFHEKGSFKSIVFVGKKETLNLTEELQALFHENTFKTEIITKDQALELIKNRIGEMTILPEEVIEEIYKKSNKNPRELLENCEDACRFAIENEIEVLDKKAIKEIL